MKTYERSLQALPFPPSPCRTRLSFRVLACIASVSVRFRSKDRGTRVKDCAKNGASWLSFHFSLGQNRYFFAPKPNRNAWYAGYLRAWIAASEAPSPREYNRQNRVGIPTSLPYPPKGSRVVMRAFFLIVWFQAKRKSYLGDKAEKIRLFGSQQWSVAFLKCVACWSYLKFFLMVSRVSLKYFY